MRFKLSLLLASLGILPSFGQQTEIDCIDVLEGFSSRLQKCVPICAEDKMFNESTGKCEDAPQECADWEEWSGELGKCITPCGEGRVYDESSDSCVDNTISSTCSIKCDLEEETLDRDKCRCTRLIDDCCKASSDDYDIRLVSTKKCNCEKKCEDLGTGYACVKSHICRNGEINTDGTGILVAYSAAPTIDLADHSCPGHLTCCKNPNINEKLIPAPPKPPVDVNKCGRTAKPEIQLIDSRNEGNALEDYTAQIGEFPHMCIFYSQLQGSQAYRGGASLIGRKFLLTAAHKIYHVKTNKPHDIREEQLGGRCGVLNVKRMEPNFPEPQDRLVKEVLIHPEYNPELLTHNIAILFVSEPFEFVNHISPVCLPKLNANYTGSKECYSTGFGADSYDRPEYSDLLKKVKLPVVNSKQCQKTIQDLPRFNEKRFIVYDNWICVGGEGEEDTCRGDGGSPHVCKHNNEWVQVGAVAFGFGCGKQGLPSVYSGVAPEMCWIDWIMSCQESLPSSIVSVVDQRNAGEPTTVDSVNGISRRECSKWLNDRPDLLKQCKVKYQ